MHEFILSADFILDSEYNDLITFKLLLIMIGVT